MKICSKCEISKPAAQFRKDPRYRGGRFCWCHDCVHNYSCSPEKLACDKVRRKRQFADPEVRKAYNATKRAWYHTPAGKRLHKSGHYRRDYGITLEAFEIRCAELAHKCEICGRKSKLSPDHNHKTGKFRGAICPGCNIGLGALEALPGLFEKFQTYIKERP